MGDNRLRYPDRTFCVDKSNYFYCSDKKDVVFLGTLYKINSD